MGHMPVYGTAQTKLGDAAYAGMVCHPVWTTMHLYLLDYNSETTYLLDMQCSRRIAQSVMYI